MTNARNEDDECVEIDLESLDDDQIHPMAESITRFLHKARDIKWTVRVFMPVSLDLMNARRQRAIADIESGDSLLASLDPIDRIHGIKQTQEAMRKIERINYSQIPELIETSLFLSLFSAFDVYTGELMIALYERKPQLFDNLNRKVDLVDVLTANSIEELKKSVLDEEIGSFRRKSYVEQFTELESRFGAKLKAFDQWANFVECTQRRNLFTHCGGIVSEQYRKICKNEGLPEKDIAAIGTQLDLGPDYFLSTCELMIEVGLKLSQTLWRKVLSDEIEEADKHLHRTQYDALYSHNWDRAVVFGKFAVKLPRFSNQKTRCICIINYCINSNF